MDDAHAVQQVLENPAIGDFEVKTVVDGKSYELAEEIEAFFADQPRDSLLVVYLSCHGVKDEDGRLYFAASNTKLNRLAATGLSAQFVYEQMEECRSRQLVLLLDCCYSGAFGRYASKGDGRVDVTERLSGRGRVVITASTAMEYAFESGKTSEANVGSSIFTHALVQGLSTGQADLDGDGRVSVDDLYDYVHREVRSVTPNQTPSMQAQVEGTIYLARRAALSRGGELISLNPPVEQDVSRPAGTGTTPGIEAAPDRGPEAVPDRGPEAASDRDPEAAPDPGPEPAPDRRPIGRRRSRRVLLIAAAGVVALAAVLAFVLHPWSPTPRWTTLPALPVSLEAAAVSDYDGRLWVVGGLSAEKGRAMLSEVRIYDPGTQTWRAGPALPVATSHAALVSTGQQLFLVGGLTKTGSVATVYRLDSPTGQWTADVPLPAARGAGAASYDGSRIVFGGGVGTDGRAKSEVWAFQGGRWQLMGRLSRAREKLASTTDGYGTVWFFAGRDPNAAQTAFAEADVVQSASVKADQGVPAVAGAAAVWWPESGPCLIGGQAPDGFRRQVACRDPAARPPDLTSARAGLGAAVIGSSVYVVGGYDAGHHGSATVEVFDTAADR